MIGSISPHSPTGRGRGGFERAARVEAEPRGVRPVPSAPSRAPGVILTTTLVAAALFAPGASQGQSHNYVITSGGGHGGDSEITFIPPGPPPPPSVLILTPDDPDDGVAEFELPFDFPVFDEFIPAGTTLYISTNGVISVGAPVRSPQNPRLPDPSRQQVLFAPFWEDHRLGASGSLRVHFTTEFPFRPFGGPLALTNPHHAHLDSPVLSIAWVDIENKRSGLRFTAGVTLFANGDIALTGPQLPFSTSLNRDPVWLPFRLGVGARATVGVQGGRHAASLRCSPGCDTFSAIIDMQNQPFARRSYLFVRRPVQSPNLRVVSAGPIPSAGETPGQGLPPCRDSNTRHTMDRIEVPFVVENAGTARSQATHFIIYNEPKRAPPDAPFFPEPRTFGPVDDGRIGYLAGMVSDGPQQTHPEWDYSVTRVPALEPGQQYSGSVFICGAGPNPASFWAHVNPYVRFPLETDYSDNRLFIGVQPLPYRPPPPRPPVAWYADPYLEQPMPIDRFPVARVGWPYDFQLPRYGTTPMFSRDDISFILPEWRGQGPASGLGLDVRGRLKGIPLEAGSHDVWVWVWGPPPAGETVFSSTHQRLRLDIIDPGHLRVTTSTLPDGYRNLSYEATIRFDGGVPPHDLELLDGPPGFRLGSSSEELARRLVGLPEAGGRFPVRLGLEDGRGDRVEAELTLLIDAPPAVRLRPTELPSGQVGRRYEAQITAEGGAPPLRLAAESVPPGLSFDPADGRIAGLPTETGQFSVRATVTDEFGDMDERAFELTILPEAPPLSFASERLTFELGVAPSLSLRSEGGQPPYQFASVDALPAGLELETSGQFRGLPTEPSPATWTEFSVTDALEQTIVRRLLVEVLEPTEEPNPQEPSPSEPLDPGCGCNTSTGTPSSSAHFAFAALLLFARRRTRRAACPVS